MHFVQSQTANAGTSNNSKPNSPLFARAARYSEGNAPLGLGGPLGLVCMSSPESERKQKSKSFLKNNFLINRLRSGSWHASSSSSGRKLPTGPRRVSEGSQQTGLFPGSSAKVPELEIQYEEENEFSGLIHHILESHLWNVEFDENKAAEMCGLLSKVLEKSVKSRLSSDGNDYKISAIVYMAEVKDDGMKMATQCAWEPTQDYFAMSTYETDTIFVVAMIFAVLFNESTDE